MLFDVNPKERREDLYDRERELNEVFEALGLGERLVVIYGIRRVGKSSVLRVALKEANVPHAIVDVKGLYFEYGVISKEALYRNLANFFARNLGFLEKTGFRVRDVLSRVRGFHVTEVGVEVEPTSSLASFTELLGRIDDWCERRGLRFVMAFDEAQYLRFGGAVKYDGIIAWCVDNLPNVTFIVTGSEVGLLKDFLRIDDPRAPLFGRYRREVVVERFSRDQSIGFLRRGFAELGTAVRDFELEEVVDTFDGIVGWLTYYGYYRAVRGLPHREALSKVFDDGSKLVLSELEKVIAPSKKRYAAILKAVAQGAASWSDIKTHVVARTGYVTDKRFTDLLKNLVKYGYLAKDGNEYGIPDPVVRHACMLLD